MNQGSLRLLVLPTIYLSLPLQASHKKGQQEIPASLLFLKRKVLLLFGALEVEACDVNAVGIGFVTLRFHTGGDAHQFPAFAEHGVDLAVDHRVVGGDVLEADATDIEEVQQLGFLEVFDADFAAVGFVAGVVFGRAYRGEILVIPLL